MEITGWFNEQSGGGTARQGQILDQQNSKLSNQSPPGMANLKRGGLDIPIIHTTLYHDPP